jgi:hypothetical protein
MKLPQHFSNGKFVKNRSQLIHNALLSFLVQEGK